MGEAKESLTLKEPALLLNVSPLNFRRWTLAGKVNNDFPQIKKTVEHYFIKRTDQNSRKQT